MDITNRNFFRVLRQGAFGVSEELEPISQFKWNRILQIAMDQDLFPYIARGLMNHYNDKDICLPQASWNEISTEAQKKQPDIRSIILNILQQEPLPSNVLLKYKYKHILRKDSQAEDANIDTQQFLTIIVNNINMMFSHGIPLKGIVEMGLFLRQRGDKIDFVRLEHWLHQLGFVRMACLMGTVLVEHLGFSPAELPFMSKKEKRGAQLASRTLSENALDNAEIWHFRMRTNGMVENNSQILRRNLRRSLRYARYNPIETISNFIANFAKSLSEIEE